MRNRVYAFGINKKDVNTASMMKDNNAILALTDINLLTDFVQN